MSDRIYTDSESLSNGDYVTVAQACRGILAKRHFIDKPSQSYDQVKYFNLFELNIWSLDELYTWSQRLLTKPKCCFIRARIKDRSKWKHVLRRAYDRDDSEATLIPYRGHWFAIDIDGYGISTGELVTDTHLVLRALPSCFSNVECFAIASASYGRKAEIHLRLFFWSQQSVTNKDILRALRFNNKAKADLTIYQNPVQPIYTAAPIFDCGFDPIKRRSVWIQGDFASVNIPSETINERGKAENVYTYDEAVAMATKYYSNISRLDSGDRHNGLIQWCYPLGKLVGQGHFEKEDVIDRAFNHCSFWVGKRDTDKDMKTIRYAIDRGIDSMDHGDEGNVI